jgi:hypothetical protein
MDMSNRTIDLVIARLRLLARADVVCDAYGRHLKGEINQAIEDLRIRLSDAYDHVTSINQFTNEQLELLHMGASICSRNLQIIRELERELV